MVLIIQRETEASHAAYLLDDQQRGDPWLQQITDSPAAALEMNEAVQRFLAGAASTEFSDHYARLFCRIESGDERYAWVNRTLFVGETRLVVDGDALRAEVRIHRVS